MKTKPLIFNTEMVKAILDGRKTVTRRPVNWFRDEGWSLSFDNGSVVESLRQNKPMPTGIKPPCSIGDLLWVRETFAALGHDDYKEVSPRNRSEIQEFRYKASEPEALANVKDWEVRGYHWHPSIHMPRHASRLTLKVTGVRLERVKDITPKEALKEGFNDWTGFAFTWSSIYLNQGLGWDDNPYVWVIGFEVMNMNVDSALIALKCN